MSRCLCTDARPSAATDRPWHWLIPTDAEPMSPGFGQGQGCCLFIISVMCWITCCVHKRVLCIVVNKMSTMNEIPWVCFIWVLMSLKWQIGSKTAPEHFESWQRQITHLPAPWKKWPQLWQTTTSNTFSWMKMTPIRFSLKFVPRSPIDNKPALV